MQECITEFSKKNISKDILKTFSQEKDREKVTKI